MIRIIICIAAIMFLGFLSGFSTTESISTWYSTLNKPPFNPPNWIFGPVWSILYCMMGIAAGRVWNAIAKNNLPWTALIIFGVQFALNLLWSFLFFNLQNPFIALIEIIALLFFIVLTIIYFRKIDILSSRLMIPYLLWVSFATILNFSIWYLN